MGRVFSSVIGTWKISSAMTVNSPRATILADTAAGFALQEAKTRFFSGTFNFGTRNAPCIVLNDGNGGTADYWIELPGVNDDFTTGPNDDTVDDDGDDSNPNLYTIIATGRVVHDNGTILAQRQAKVFVDISPLSLPELKPGVHTDGAIDGNGVAGFRMYKFNNPPP